MTRGNQRDVDRARAKKRADKTGKPTAKDKDGLTALQRRERYVSFVLSHSNSVLKGQKSVGRKTCQKTA